MTDSALLPPTLLTRYGRFQVVRQIAIGGTGRVLEVIDPDLERVVALKVVPVGDDQGLRERLLAEARIASRLEHPNIVPVYEMGAQDGWLYFAMRLISGHSLSQVLRGRGRDEEWADGWTRHKLLTAFLTLCRAVVYAHEQGVIHQDLKPANVMLGQYGEVQLVDWGIAQAMENPLDGVSAGDIVRGTPGYISPERVRGRKDDLIDERSDIWALGVILYEMLTLRRAFRGKTPVDVLLASVRRSAPEPDALARARIPADLAGICTRAMAMRRDERYPSVLELCHAVEGYLDGRARRERAAEHLAAAHSHQADLRELVAQRARITAEIEAESARVPVWAPLDDKRALLDLRQQLVDLEPRRAAIFARCVGAAERAATEDAESRAPRTFLARAFWSRFLEAEAAGDRVEQTFFIERVQEWDDGELAEERRGAGQLSLTTDPAGAEVICQRYDTDHFIWHLGPEQSLGTTPIAQLPMDMGRYLLTLRHPERDPVRYPVAITRLRHWEGGTVALPASGQIADGFVLVAGGPFRRGGDPEAQDGQPGDEVVVPTFAAARFQVTMGEYCAFLNALHRRDPDAAWGRVPRYESGVKVKAGQYWARPPADGEYAVPTVDRDGDPWDPDWAVMGVSWEDARAYADWRSREEGRLFRLPTELQWEKAARGVDGRLFPWGDGFDPSLCHMRLTNEGRPQPKTIGAHPTDVSVYGVQDLAGGVRDWCHEESYEGAETRRPVRGGSWDSHQRYCRLAHRTGYTPWYVATSFGIRLVQILETSPTEQTVPVPTLDETGATVTSMSTTPMWSVNEDWLDTDE